MAYVELKNHFTTLGLYFNKNIAQKNSYIKTLKRIQLCLEKDLLLDRQLVFYLKDFENVGFDIHLVGQKRIKELNQQYRGKNKVTDVLSFPIFSTLRDERDLNDVHGQIFLGDIFICHDVLKKQAHSFKISPPLELAHLVVHGVLHLLGFDHEKGGQEEKIMTKWEDKLILKFGQLKRKT